MNSPVIQSRTLASVAVMRWKNGGGVTRELLAWPRQDDWSVRVSVADIERDGPFSAFPGIERHFAVLEGAGVELEGIGTVLRGSEPIMFDGAQARECRLLAGATRDLNVMIRRDRGRGFLQRIVASDDSVLAKDCAVNGVYDADKEALYWCEGDAVLWPDARSAISRQRFHFAFRLHEVLLDE